MESLVHAMPLALAHLLRNTPMSRGKIEFAWKAVVGPAIDRGTAVHLEGRVLYVDAKTAAWAREVSRSSALILTRLQALLGPDVIQELMIRV
jgi:predicted nucleic acid-binding Zn ribbon protein